MGGGFKGIFERKKSENARREENLLEFRRPIHAKDDLRMLNKMLKGGGFHSGGKRAKRPFSSGFVLPEKKQRCAFFMTYSDTMKSHDKYIEYYMPQMNKENVVEKPDLFGMPQEEYEKYKVAKNYKCVISPESQDVDLKTTVGSFIRRVELQTGYMLCWRAAIHNDTSHRHAHVVINGKDQNGKRIYFNKEIIMLMRAMCCDAVTQQIGERTPVQIQLERRNLTRANRWTKLDALFENAQTAFRPLLKAEEKERLEYLKTLGLADFDKASERYAFRKDWKEVLQASGRYNAFFKEWQERRGNLELYQGGSVRGKVQKVITFGEDESWSDAVIIEQGGKNVYVPVWQLQKENLKGKVVEIAKNKRTIGRQVSDKDISVRE